MIVKRYARNSKNAALESAEMLAVEIIADIVPYLRDETEYLHVAELEEMARRVCHSIESVPTKEERQTFQNYAGRN